MADIAIRNEDDLNKQFASLNLEGLQEGDNIYFDNWPEYEIIIQGESFNGGVPTRIMPRLVRLQKVIRDEYSLYRYGEIRRLSEEEKKATELVLFLHSGRSTIFKINLGDVLNNILNLLGEKMTGKELGTTMVAITFVIAGAWGGTSVMINHLENIRHEAVLEDKQDAREAENERLKIFKETVEMFAQKEPMILESYENMISAQEQVFKGLDKDDTLILESEEGDFVITGDELKTILRKPRTAAIESRIDGTFKIMSVDSGSIKNGYKLKVQSIDTEDGEILTVLAPKGTLSEKQIKILQSGEWDKKPLSMEINIRKIEDRIVRATLIEAGLSQE